MMHSHHSWKNNCILFPASCLQEFTLTPIFCRKIPVQENTCSDCNSRNMRGNFILHHLMICVPLISPANVQIVSQLDIRLIPSLALQLHSTVWETTGINKHLTRSKRCMSVVYKQNKLIGGLFVKYLPHSIIVM